MCKKIEDFIGKERGLRKKIKEKTLFLYENYFFTKLLEQLILNILIF